MENVKADAAHKDLIVIAGPTASGKTALAVSLAEALDGEVISADSMQVYQGIPISTAQPTTEEMRGIPHHLIGYVPLSEPYSVARYAVDARQTIDDCLKRGKCPILCGGTGLYIAAVTDNVLYEGQDASDTAAIRERLQAECRRVGEDVMLERLRAVDPVLAEKLHPNDRGRVIRGLEVYELTGERMSDLQRRQASATPRYAFEMLVLDFHDRAALYDRIDRRVDQMMKQGLLEEAKSVLSSPFPTAAQAIGCKELRPYFEGSCTLEEAIEQLKRGTRRYAKRQLSWFRRLESATRLYVDEYPSATALFNAVLAILK
ncbi:MAG: tRNA (adenosine(37)-N6)-dimethylallyltransferase MiaA [Clostridia bacterium]|nr:tRNA (adenosine(37)-N6)-dimethylallyltransferase MiaA [Clostridia bacterium]